MTCDTNQSKLDIISLRIASTVWITSSIGFFIYQLLPSFSTQPLVENIITFFLVLSYWLLFPICIVMSIVALIQKIGSRINCIGTLMLTLPPLCYIIYSAIELHKRTADLL